MTRRRAGDPPGGMMPREFEALLGSLHSDREKAGELYETIRRKLIRLFEWRNCPSPEDLADETINRVARRVEAGLEFEEAPYSYFCGVAHHVYKEVWRQKDREQKALADWPTPVPAPDPEEDRRLEVLRRCLESLPAEQKRLILEYYQGESNIRGRKSLSQELGIPINALRIRVHRVRRKVESCLEKALAN